MALGEPRKLRLPFQEQDAENKPRTHRKAPLRTPRRIGSHKFLITEKMSTIPEHYPFTYKRQIMQEFQQMESRIGGHYGQFHSVPEAGLRFQISGKSTSSQRSRGWNDTNPAQPVRRERWLKMTDADSNNARDYRTNDEWIDELDHKRLGQIGDPTPDRIASQMARCKRDADLAIITGLGGVAFSGATDGSTQVAYDADFTIDKAVGFATAPDATNPGGLGYNKLIRLNAVLGAANVTGQRVESNSKKAIVCTHFEIEDLLDDDKLINKDFADRSRAEAGEVFDYQGTTFIPVSPELLPITGSAGSYLRTCYGFAKAAIAIGSGTSKIHEVTKENTKNGSLLLHLVSGITCSRLYDYGVYKVESHRMDAQQAVEVVYETL